MKKLSLIAVVLMVGYVMGSISLDVGNAAAKKPPKIMLCLAGIPCEEVTSNVAPGIVKQVVQIIQDVQDTFYNWTESIVRDVAHEMIVEYMEANPCQCENAPAAPTTVMEEPAFDLFLAGAPNEVINLSMPVSGKVVQDSKADFWQRVVDPVTNETLYIPMFR